MSVDLSISKHRQPLAILAFLALSAALLWPLPRHLASALPGDPNGDLGVYVWNLWIFRHEFLDHARLPLSTDHVFAYTGAADFSLHNYTPLAGMLGMPFMAILGVVPTFNLVLIVVVAASGYATRVLARRLGLSEAAAMAAGALFIATPVITAREVAHLSLVSAASLPLFMWALLRVLDSGRARDAVLVGIVVALASYSDAYFGVYCVMMGLFTLAWQFVDLRFTRRPTDTVAARGLGALQVFAFVAVTVTCLLLARGIDAFELRGVLVRVGLHGPVLLLVAATIARAWYRNAPRLSLHDPDRRLPGLVRLGAIATAVCLLLMIPPLAGLAERALSGRFPETPIFWRSSPRGVDLLAYVVPNPLHPLFGAQTSQWFMPPQQDAFPEFVAAFSLVALAVIGLAGLRRSLPRFWIWFTILFGSLSLGPFVHVAGIDTFVPGPWALLRYVPLIGMARAPSRFAILAVLGGSMLFGFALDALRSAGVRRFRLLSATVAALLVAELTPVPRPLFTADVPQVYDLLSTGDESQALLELPTGIRDGTSSLGDFNPASQFFQTRHGRRLIGGYLSRVSSWRKQQTMSNPTLRVLVALSEPGGRVEAAQVDEARANRDTFLSRTCLGYVVLNRHRSSPELRAAAVDVLRLELVHADPDFELLRPMEPPPCQLRAPSGWRRPGGSLRLASAR